MVTNRNGQEKYGPRQSMDILNPDFLRYAERIIRKLLEAVMPYSCVIGFQLDNETKHYDNYGKYAQKKFLDFLKNKYKTTDAFNWQLGRHAGHFQQHQLEPSLPIRKILKKLRRRLLKMAG